MENNTVLVVEDDEDIRDSMKLLLSLSGYSVAMAANGQVALDMLKQNSVQPSVILLDHMMPIMDGRTFLEEIAKDRELSALGLPIILLSAAQIERPRGVVGFLKKPIDISALMTAVKEHTERR